MKTITLSADNIYSYCTKPEGYGRKGLYLSLYNLDGCPNQDIHFGSVFPNPEEHWGLHTDDDTYAKLDDDGNEVEGAFVDCNGNDVDADRIFPTIFDGIVAMVSGDEVEVEEYEEEADETEE